ncbi:glycoside/pentoside/hexuronide:cation symporter, GPH family [Verrucomicrobium sp. GAS474]|uniref:MFS transporter n=1 Tax=Verrucomicrobium sp. GAS474 TaxID=1882831 RepID=UPI00087A63E7|nr:MFS transporter [Verrucomicrobium sp. GAS474]SDU02714.1 glycoside/pentoside/hexuronide:cation symporter, GPH family [Verrucomicrobium sp. GAS474]
MKCDTAPHTLNDSATAAASPPIVSPGDRIPLFQKAMFGAGFGVDSIAMGLLTSLFWMPYFNIGLGLDPVLLSTVLVILQVWNAMIDPVMGNLSDNTRTRWGRRRPFMFVGAILTGASFIAIWHIPVGVSPLRDGVYLSLAGMAFFLSFSSWAMPYYGLQLELTPSYDERTNLTAWITFFGKIFGLGTGWAMAFASSRWFADFATGRPDIVHGIRASSWIFGLVITAVGLLPALFVKERYYEREARSQAHDPFWASIRESAQCRSLRMLIAISFFVVLGYTSIAVLGGYVNIYCLTGGDIALASVIAGWKSTAVFVTGILMLPLWTWLGERHDKRTMVASMIGFSMFGHLLNLFCMRADMPYLQIVPGVFESGTIGALWLYLPSMKADVADHDELHTARRREGALNAFYSCFVKAALACGTGIGGLLLALTHFDAKAASQPRPVLDRMFWLYIFVPIVFWAISFLFIRLYPLSRERMSEIRAVLEARRGRL